MEHSGELVAFGVAALWTASAVLSETGSKRMGVWASNVMRMVLALTMLSCVLAATGGFDIVAGADVDAWLWLLGSGIVGYTFGDYCLFSAYRIIGARFGQLFMTLAPLAAALSAFVLLGERMTWMAVCGMTLTVGGIMMSIMGRKEKADGHKALGLKLPLRGVLMGLGAALGQGLGLVMSKTGMALMTEQGFVASMAGTFMRGLAGMAGFVALLFLLKRQHEMRATVEGRNLAVLAGMAFFGPTLGVSLSLLAAMLTDVGVAQTIMSITPILILVPAYFFRHERVTAAEIVGAVVSFIGVSLFFV